MNGVRKIHGIVMLKYILRVSFFCCIFLSPFFVCGQQIYSEDSLEFEYTALQLEVESLRKEVVGLNESIDALKNRNKELHLINDTLTVVNNEINKQLSEKNALLEEKIRILQQKEILFAEKEQLYKEAISNSNVDKAKVEGLVEAKNASIVGKDKEISLLQKSISRIFTCTSS